ncbi:MAG: alpha/beta hydrolase [Proteobacteria bacterium]|nr:alpha/beta hydrolase [Pseudomonadota bacterium]
MKNLLPWLRRHWRAVLIVTLITGFAGVNAIAYRHAGAMMHFVRSGERTPSPEKLTLLDKVKVLLTGVTLPRPENRRTPKDLRLAFQTLHFPGTKGIELETWLIQATNAPTNGIVVLFHGYGASKESLLAPAAEFHALDWDTLLVDFHGSGGSAGAATTVRWFEADDVQAAFAEAARLAPGRSRVLFGPSMGAVACLRAIQVHGLKPDALIIECPFDRMLTTVRHRFHAMRVPSWPMAELLLFWRGWQGGFDCFQHNPVDYAASVNCPTLLMHGQNDPRAHVPEAPRPSVAGLSSERSARARTGGRSHFRRPARSQDLENLHRSGPPILR